MKPEQMEAMLEKRQAMIDELDKVVESGEMTREEADELMKSVDILIDGATSENRGLRSYIKKEVNKIMGDISS